MEPRVVSGEWVVELARPEDDAELRRLAAQNPVPGRITLGFEREPNYFAACRTMGQFTQVAVARHRESGAIGAMACRAVRRRFMNGVERPVGYLSQLRVDRPYRGEWLGATVLRALPLLHADERAPGYLATISDGNDEARGLLASRPRRGMPEFREVARLRTLALHVRRALEHEAGGSFRLGESEDLDDVVDFLREEGSRRQWFPALSREDFGPGGNLPGLELGDFVLAWREGRLVGAVALWDQRRLKQTVVRGYDGALRRLRPIYNLWARLTGAVTDPLPAPGGELLSAYASFLAVARDDRAVCRALLRRLLELASSRGLTYVLVGLAAGDPLLPVARSFPHTPYGSTLYAVNVPGADGDFHALPDGRRALREQ